MQGAPHRQARSSARSFFLLPSVLALLALALFPVVAHAESSSGATYEVEVPNIESKPSTGTHNSGKSATHHKSSNNPTAEGSAAETGGTGSEGSEKGNGSSEGHEPKGSSSKEEESHPSTGAGGNGGGNKPNGGGQGENGLSGNTPVAHTGTPHSSSSGGSSPVLPILIAVVVLAAISIGVVLYRQRKSGQGGSDGRVSSSNAS